MKVTKGYKPCEKCKGTGVIHWTKHTPTLQGDRGEIFVCNICFGEGEIVTTYNVQYAD